MSFNRLVNFTMRMAATIAATAIHASAQCAMCKANIANAENAAEVSGRMNSAVLVLLIPTLLVIGGLIRLVFKYRHPVNDKFSSPNPYVHCRPSDAQRNSQ
jgi:heme/copper-type cytochrome/quinol oxidase subunit 2